MERRRPERNQGIGDIGAILVRRSLIMITVLWLRVKLLLQFLRNNELLTRTQQDSSQYLTANAMYCGICRVAS